VKLYKSVFIALSVITTTAATAQNKTAKDSTSTKSTRHGWFSRLFKKRSKSGSTTAHSAAVRGGFGKRAGRASA